MLDAPVELARLYVCMGEGRPSLPSPCTKEKNNIMSKMSTVPVFACRDCGKAVYATHLSTNLDDPDGNLLRVLMKGLSEIARCPECQKRWNWFASQNRSDEYYKNFYNPQGVLYNVRPGVSQVDWYGRNRS